MTHTIYAVTLLLFATIHYANASQKPMTKALTEQDKRDADAAEYRRRVAAMGGKMLHLDDDEIVTEQKNKSKITDKTTNKTDVRARL